MTDNGHDNAGHSDIATIAEAAIRLGKSERTIRRMISSGKLSTVEIGGKMCVQLAGSDKVSDMSGASVQCPAELDTMSGMVSNDRAEIEDSLRDIIRRQDGEISFLRDRVKALEERLALPAPRQESTDTDMERIAIMQTHTELMHAIQERKGGGVSWWVFVLVIGVLAAAIGGVAWWQHIVS